MPVVDFVGVIRHTDTCYFLSPAVGAMTIDENEAACLQVGTLNKHMKLENDDTLWGQVMRLGN